MELIVKEKFRPSRDEILADVAALEKELATELPAELKNFLIEAAATYPEPGGFDILDCPDAENDECFGFFGGRGDGYLETLKCYRGRIPDDLLPIGYGSFGDSICYLLTGDEAGSVWYWNHETESPETYADRSNCYKCADSLQEFLDGLYECDEEEEEDDEEEDDE